MFFQLPKNIYAGKWGKSIIILDAEKDKYLSIVDKAADAFLATVTSEFTYEEGSYIPVKSLQSNVEPEMLTAFISHFITTGFVESVKKKRPYVMAEEISKGGLEGYQWDHKSSLAPFSMTSKLALLKASYTLYRVHYLLKKQGIKGVLDAIAQQKSVRKEYRIPSEQEIKVLSDCIDVASALYIKKVYCLGWASTFVLEALKRGWECSLAIGVQGIPFYAHAWAECNGAVINDEEAIKQYLTVLLKEPFNAN